MLQSTRNISKKRCKKFEKIKQQGVSSKGDSYLIFVIQFVCKSFQAQLYCNDQRKCKGAASVLSPHSQAARLVHSTDQCCYCFLVILAIFAFKCAYRCNVLQRKYLLRFVITCRESRTIESFAQQSSFKTNRKIWFSQKSIRAPCSSSRTYLHRHCCLPWSAHLMNPQES